MYLYLYLNLGAILFPLLFSFHPKLQFYKEWKWFFPANLLVALVFIIWDAWFTDMGVWGFNPKYVTGQYFLGLPIEEILFFICIPYASLFTLHALKQIFPHFKIANQARTTITILLIIISLIIALFNSDKIYTYLAFFSAVIMLVTARFMLKEKMDHFYLMYSFILIPFLIINGILTGTGIPGEVVWYNNAENLSIRILTIPVEDVFYGMALLLMNVSLMHLLKKIFSRSGPGFSSAFDFK